MRKHAAVLALLLVASSCGANVETTAPVVSAAVTTAAAAIPTTTVVPTTVAPTATTAPTVAPTTTAAPTTTTVAPTTTAAPPTAAPTTTTTVAPTTTATPTPHTREGFSPGQLSWNPKQLVEARDLSYIEASGTDSMEFYLSSRPTRSVVLDITWDPTEVLIGPAAGGCNLPDESVTVGTLRKSLGADTWLDGARFAMAGAGDGIDDGDQVTELRIAVVDELSDAAYHDAADLVAYVTTRNRADGAVCH